MGRLILVCTATGVEARACRKGLQSNTQFEVLQTGQGYENATKSLEARLKDESRIRPSLIISSGFAGSRTNKNEIGTWAVGTSVSYQSQAPIAPENQISWWLKNASLKWNTSTYLTVDRIITGDKEATHTGAVDMESYALGSAAKNQKIPFEILRLISDTPEHPIPRAIAKGNPFLAVKEPVLFGQFIYRGVGLVSKLTADWMSIGRVV